MVVANGCISTLTIVDIIVALPRTPTISRHGLPSSLISHGCPKKDLAQRHELEPKMKPAKSGCLCKWDVPVIKTTIL